MIKLTKSNDYTVYIARQTTWDTPAPLTTGIYYKIHSEATQFGYDEFSEYNANKLVRYVGINASIIEDNNQLLTNVGDNVLYRVKLRLRLVPGNLAIVHNYCPKIRNTSSGFFSFGGTPIKINYNLNEGRLCTMVIINNGYSASVMPRFQFYNGIVDSYRINYDIDNNDGYIDVEFVFTKANINSSIGVPSTVNIISNEFMPKNYTVEYMGSTYPLKEFSISEKYNVKLLSRKYITYDIDSEHIFYFPYVEFHRYILDDIVTLYFNENNATISVDVNGAPITKKETVFEDDTLKLKCTAKGKIISYVPLLTGL